MFPHATCMCIQNAKRNDPKNDPNEESTPPPTSTVYTAAIPNPWTIVESYAPIKIDVLSTSNADGLIKADKSFPKTITKAQVMYWL